MLDTATSRRARKLETEGCWSKQKEEGKGEINDQAVGDHERGGNSRRREGEGKKGEKCPGGKKEEEETKKKSGEPAGRNELEVNQTYRSYRSRYHYHLPNYYLQQVYIWTLPRLPYPMYRIVCQNSEITYVLYLSRGHVGVPYSSRCSFSRFLLRSKHNHYDPRSSLTERLSSNFSIMN